MMSPPQTSSLLSAYKDGRLSRAHVERLADELAMRHSKLASEFEHCLDSRSECLHPGELYADCLGKASRIQEALPTGLAEATLSRVEESQKSYLKKAAPSGYLKRRGIGYSGTCGRVLQNVFLHEGQMLLQISPGPTASARERDGDALGDVASVIVELELLEQRVLGNHFLAAWLEESGDFDALGILRPYLVREALAFVAHQLVSPASLEHAGVQDAGSGVQRALRIANKYADEDRTGAMIITHGLSGAGKTTLATALAGSVGAIVVRNDAETSRLWRDRPVSAGNSTARPAKLIDRLETLAVEAITAGWPVIVESCFLNRGNRNRFRSKAADLGVGFCILDCSTPLATVRDRLNKRRAFGSLFHGEDVTVATMEEKLQAQIGRSDPLDQDERRMTITVDTGHQVDHRKLAKQILGLTHSPEVTAEIAEPGDFHLSRV